MSLRNPQRHLSSVFSFLLKYWARETSAPVRIFVFVLIYFTLTEPSQCSIAFNNDLIKTRNAVCRIMSKSCRIYLKLFWFSFLFLNRSEKPICNLSTSNFSYTQFWVLVQKSGFYCTSSRLLLIFHSYSAQIKHEDSWF